MDLPSEGAPSSSSSSSSSFDASICSSKANKNNNKSDTDNNNNNNIASNNNNNNTRSNVYGIYTSTRIPPELEEMLFAITASSSSSSSSSSFSSSSSSSDLSPHPMDVPKFDIIEYINKHFPNEQSLNKLDDFILKLQNEIKTLDMQILHSVREQAGKQGKSSEREIEKINASISELLEKINLIKMRACDSQRLVYEICRDIKALDICKKNLTTTITALKRLVMLVTALDNLRGYAAERNYKSASDSVSAICILFKHFDKMKKNTKIMELAEQKKFIFNELEKQISEDFDSLFEENEGGVNENEPDYASKLKDACYVIDMINSNNYNSHKHNKKNDIITNFCLKILEKYKKIFSPGTEAYGLEATERRFSWLKRCLREFDDKYSNLFPCSWYVPCHLAEHFCHITRQHLVEILSSCHHTVNPDLLVSTLQKAIEFENALVCKFQSNEVGNTKYLNELISQLEEDNKQPNYIHSIRGELQYPDVLEKDIQAEKKEEENKRNITNDSNINSNNNNNNTRNDACYNARFKGIISECFEAYLGGWVKHEEQTLMDLLSSESLNDNIIGDEHNNSHMQHTKKCIGEDGMLDGGNEGEEEEDIPRFVYSSASAIFSAFRLCIKKTATISEHQTLFEMFQVFKRVIKRYIDILNNRLPKKNSIKLNEETAKVVGCVVGTAEYIDGTLNDLLNAILKIIDQSFHGSLNFDYEKDMLWNVKSAGLQSLLSGVELELEAPFNQMTQTNWVALQEVGDSSAYVTEIGEILHAIYPVFYKYLSFSFYRFFSDKFAQMFISKFISSIYACKKIGQLGAQQLLLNAYSLKATLLELPVVSANGNKMPLAYSKFVVREMNKAEALLKVLTSNSHDSSSIQAFMDDEEYFESGEEINKILALRVDSSLGSSGGVSAYFSSSSNTSNANNNVNANTRHGTNHNSSSSNFSYNSLLQPSSLTSGADSQHSGGGVLPSVDISREFQSIGGTLREQSIKAAGDMKNFLGRFSKQKLSSNDNKKT